MGFKSPTQGFRGEEEQLMMMSQKKNSVSGGVLEDRFNSIQSFNLCRT